MKSSLLSSFTNRQNWGAIQIAGLYLLIGALWILFSDQLAARIAVNREMLTRISLYKGWGYVLVTALLLYWLIRRHTVALTSGEMQRQVVIDAFPALIAYVDSNRRYQFTNKTYNEWFGASPLGKSIEEMFEKREYEKISKYVERALEGETVTYEMVLSYPSGERFVSATYIPDIGSTGQVKGLFVLVQDLTERKQAQEELRLWADAFEGCAHGIAIDDSNTNRIVACNSAFARIHQRSADELIGSAILSLYTPEDHDHVRRHVRRADQIGHSRFEARMVRKDGSTFPVQMDLVSVLEHGELLYRVATAQDISERKQADEKISHQGRLLQQVNDAIIATDENFEITLWNPAAERIYGWQAVEVMGKKAEDVLKTEFQSKTRAEAIRQVQEHGEFSAELIQTRKDGSRIEIDARTVTTYDSGGTIMGYVSVNRDITLRKQAEEALRRSEALLLETGKLAKVGGWELDVQTMRLVWTLEIYRIHELDPAIKPDMESAISYYAPEARGLIGEALQRAIEAGQSFDLELPIITTTGRRVWVRTIGQVESRLGRPARLFGTFQDVTERRQAEENLHRFELLSEHSRDIILFVDYRDGRILEANTAAVRAYGYSRDELRRLTIRDLRAPHTENLTAEQMAQANAGSILFETMHRRRDGAIFPVEVSSQGATLGEGRMLISIIRDITERKRAEDALRLKDQLLHLTSEMVKVGGWEFDPQTGKGTWTDEVARIHDLEPGQETNVELGLSFYVDASRSAVELAIKEAVALAKSYDLELEMTSANGTRKWVRTMGLPLLEDGKVVKVQGIFQDITERKEIEKALQAAHDELERKVQERTAALSEANALLQALMDNIPDHIYFKDTQSRFIRNSRSQAKLLGLDDPSQAVGKTDFDFFPHAARAFAEEQEVMRTGKPMVDFEEWVVWPDGREMWVSTNKVPLRDARGQTIGIFGISRDITGRKHAEQAIRQLNTDLERKAGQLEVANRELEAFSYSVSHDLRAPLRAIDGYTRILVEDYEEKLDAEGRRICGVISAEARRMGQLIDDLLAFSRLGRKEMFASRIDMNALAGSVFAELVQPPDRERIDFQLSKLPAARGDLALIHQVWVNLLSNAIKFTSKKDRPVIEIKGKQTREENIYLVRDNGAGFDMEYAGKLFGVFQRLHGESEFEGTGVGLAIVQRIIRRHGGRVWAEGAVEKGATFYFSLPRKENTHE
jgi:PAS domain S-box-containing protein